MKLLKLLTMTLIIIFIYFIYLISLVTLSALNVLKILTDLKALNAELFFFPVPVEEAYFVIVNSTREIITITASNKFILSLA